jgi:hypothetical protein
MGSCGRTKLDSAMSFRKPGIALWLVSLIALLAISVFAESWENKDWTQWTSQDCYHILDASPWKAQLSEDSSASAQIVSALVVRQALVRQAQFDQHYDKMNPIERQQFDQMANACVNLKLDDRIIVRGSSLYQYDWPAPAPEFGSSYASQVVYLAVSGGKVSAQVPPVVNAISPCPFGSLDREPATNRGHDYVFPRMVDGKQVIQPNDKKITIGVSYPLPTTVNGRPVIPPKNQKPGNNSSDRYVFNLEKMIYKGKPDF